MPVVVNSQTGLAENLPDDQAAKALQEGSHHVPLNDPEGNPVTAPMEDASRLLGQGYTQPAPDQLKNLMTTAEKSTPGQQVLTGLEGAASALTFGASSGAERVVGGVLGDLLGKEYGTTPEDILAREQVNPGVHALGEMGGLGVGMLYGAGEAGVLAKAGQGAVELAGLAKAGGLAGKAGAALIRGAAETALMSAGDEVSHLMLSDPDQSWETAAHHIGMSALIGGGVGGGLGAAFGAVEPLWKAANGSKIGQMIEDFKGAFQKDLANPDPVGSVTEQLQNRFKNITEGAEKVYGSSGIKAQAISKYLPEMNEKIATQTQEISDKLGSALKGLREAEDPLAARLEKAVNGWQREVTTPGATSGAVFDATNDLKKQLQEWGKYNKAFVSLAEKDFRDAAKGLAADLRIGLEDTGVWGQAGKIQANLNKAFSEFLPALKDFQKRFTSEVGGARVIDPGKVQTYMNQLGKPSAELKQSMMGSFLDAADRYGQKISEVHADLGLESPILATPQNLLRETLGQKSAGQKIYETLRDKAAAKTAGHTIGGALGAGVGAAVGHPYLGSLAGQATIGPILSSVIPGIVKPLLEKTANSAGLKAATEFGLSVLKGEHALNGAAKAVFQSGKMTIPQAAFPSETKIQKLKSQLDEIEKDPTKLLSVGGDTGHYLPDHQSAMAQTAARAVTYLASLKPNTDKTAPLDQNRKPNPVQQAVYNRAVLLAQQPMVAVQYLKDGRLTSQDMRTLSTIYPGWVARTQAKLTEQMIAHQSKGHIVPYKTRLGLSVFLGTPLDSTMTPAGMQLMRPPAPPMPPPPPPKAARGNQSGLNKMGKANNLYQTPNQQAESRRMVR